MIWCGDIGGEEKHEGGKLLRSGEATSMKAIKGIFSIALVAILLGMFLSLVTGSSNAENVVPANQESEVSQVEIDKQRVIVEKHKEEEVGLGELYLDSEGDIIIPTVDDIRANGYPKNENGETYGPDVWESIEEPDLLLVCNELGENGYVRQTEFDSNVTTPEEAANYRPRQHSINMYLQDGITIIGTYTIGY